MPVSKIAISIDTNLLTELDRLVEGRAFPSRSQAIASAVKEQLIRLRRSRLAAECAKLDRAEERRMAEEGIGEELEEWPEY